jgi:hypothetical protein
MSSINSLNNMNFINGSSNLYTNNSISNLNIYNDNFSSLNYKKMIVPSFDLRKSKDNFIIIQKLNKALTWCEKNEKWILIDILKIENLEKEFIEEDKSFFLENNSQIYNRDQTSVDMLNLFLLMEGNIFIDLKNKIYFEFISKDLGWHKLNLKSCCIEFSVENEIKDILKNRKNKCLMIEKILKPTLKYDLSFLNCGTINVNIPNLADNFNNINQRYYVGGIDVANNYYTVSC